MDHQLNKTDEKSLRPQKTEQEKCMRRLQLQGMKFGDLTVLYPAEKKKGRTMWHCKCSCGKEKDVATHELQSGHTKSCGCHKKSKAAYINMEGRRIGMLTVIAKTEERDSKGGIKWLCRCDCGNTCLYSQDALSRGGVVSCGCYRNEMILKQVKNRLHHIEGTCVESLLRSKPRSDSQSGFTGVYQAKNGKYCAYIGFKGKRYSLGVYEGLQDAVLARKRGEEIHIRFLDWYKNNCLSESKGN